MNKHPVRNSLLALAVLATFAQHSQAAYRVMDDDLFPTQAIPASVAARVAAMNAAPAPAVAQPQPAAAAPASRAASLDTFTILFKKGSTALTDASVESLGTLLPVMVGKYIYVTGRPDDRQNQLLAQNRGKAIRIWLMRQGIAPNQIDVQVNNTAPQLLDNESPTEIQILDAPRSKMAAVATPAALPNPTAAPIKAVASAEPATTASKQDSKGDDAKMGVLRSIAIAAQAGRIDAKAAVAMINEILATPQTNPMAPTSAPQQATNPAMIQALLHPIAAIQVAPTPAPKQELLLVAAPETARPKEWILDTNKTVRDNLVEWAAREGYRVEWMASNYYKIRGANKTLNGELLKAVDEVVEAAGLKMEVWTKNDKLIRISDVPKTVSASM